MDDEFTVKCKIEGEARTARPVERRDGECFFFEGKPYACASIGSGSGSGSGSGFNWDYDYGYCN